MESKGICGLSGGGSLTGPNGIKEFAGAHTVIQK